MSKRVTCLVINTCDRLTSEQSQAVLKALAGEVLTDQEKPNLRPAIEKLSEAAEEAGEKDQIRKIRDEAIIAQFHAQQKKQSQVEEYTMEAYKSGTRLWYFNGKRHRENGPAVEREDGTKEWWLNGLMHREDGPAIEWPCGTKEWWLNGLVHREDGPAVEWADGRKDWFLNDECITEEEHKRRTSRAPRRESDQ